MARIRTIKPQHWQDRELAKISLQAHLFWIGTWNFSDDKGVFEGDLILLRSQIFPRRTDIRTEQIKQWLDQLVKARFIIPFEYQNESYYISRTFNIHQKVDKPNPSKIPEDVIRELIDERSPNDLRKVAPIEYSSVKESKGESTRAGEFEISKSNLFKQPKIPAFEEVERIFLSRGGTAEMAKKFFETNESTGWFYRGSPITKYDSMIPGYIENWLKNEKNGKIKQNGKHQSAIQPGTVNLSDNWG